jgi:hypothetical protein
MRAVYIGFGAGVLFFLLVPVLFFQLPLRWQIRRGGVKVTGEKEFTLPAAVRHLVVSRLSYNLRIDSTKTNGYSSEDSVGLRVSGDTVFFFPSPAPGKEAEWRQFESSNRGFLNIRLGQVESVISAGEGHSGSVYFDTYRTGARYRIGARDGGISVYRMVTCNKEKSPDEAGRPCRETAALQADLEMELENLQQNGSVLQAPCRSLRLKVRNSKFSLQPNFNLQKLEVDADSATDLAMDYRMTGLLKKPFPRK